jgi:hypothetical protein
VGAGKFLFQVLSDTKVRVIGALAAAHEDLELMQRGMRTKKSFLAGKRMFEDAEATVQRACEEPLLQEVKRLGAQRAALVQRMDQMLAPFVRISQNMKGKSKIGGGDLTEDELKSIHKYISLLLKENMYEKIEDDGGSIEDFLEALFLLGIAAGVGMSDAAAKQSGLSRKSQAILADALDSFNADKFRSTYTEWRALNTRLLEVRCHHAHLNFPFYLLRRIVLIHTHCHEMRRINV